MIALTCALLAGTFVGLLFQSTRKIGLLCLTAMVLIHPYLLVLLLLVGGGAAYFVHFRQ